MSRFEKDIIGMDSALKAAKENPLANITIASSLVIDIVERIKELEEQCEDDFYEAIEAAERAE